MKTGEVQIEQENDRMKPAGGAEMSLSNLGGEHAR